MSAFDAEYVPSPWEPIAAEVERYERSGGTEPSELVGDEPGYADTWFDLERKTMASSGS